MSGPFPSGAVRGCTTAVAVRCRSGAVAGAQSVLRHAVAARTFRVVAGWGGPCSVARRQLGHARQNSGGRLCPWGQVGATWASQCYSGAPRGCCDKASCWRAGQGCGVLQHARWGGSSAAGANAAAGKLWGGVVQAHLWFVVLRIYA